MTLRQKTLTIIGVTFIVLTVVLYFISQNILLGSFAELEAQNTRQHVERVLTALSNELSSLGATANDWASWDDTYAFIADANTDYIKSNLVSGTFTGLRLNFMLFIRPAGELVFSQAFGLRNQEEIPIPRGLEGHLSANDLLLNHSDTGSGIEGIILLDEGPALVASRPILTSEYEGPVRGVLVIGRYLDTAEIDRLAETTLLSLAAYRADAGQMPLDFQEARLSLSEAVPVFIRPLDAQRVAGYALLHDIYGESALLLRVDMPRDIYQRGQASITYLMLSIVGAGLVFGVATVLLLERQVLSRLARLSQSVSRLGTSGDLSAPVVMTGKDEVSRLGDTINMITTALKRSNAELEQFAYIASHDLQEPLRMVTSYVQLIKRRYQGKLDKDADDFIAYAVDGATRMQRMINDLLNYSRVGRRGKEFQPTNCEDVLSQVVANLKLAIEESGALVTHDPLPTVMADESQLVQLFQNLVGNAIRYRNQKSPRIHVSAVDKGNERVFSVSDNGIGIEPQHFDRLFQLFQRLHAGSYSGSGIGLAVCRRIVERHGGRIWVESEVGKGSTFRFTIPLKEGGQS